LRRLQAALADNPQLAAIERAVNAGTKLTQQLLSFSRRQPQRLERVRLQEHLRHITELLSPAVGAAIVVENQVAPDTAPVEIDVAELELALLNLAINARDAMPDGGRVLITAANARDDEPAGLTGRFVVVGVRDGGHGIAPELLERVFEPFFTTKEAGRGTGLGLSQVYGFCRRAGGSAAIESQPGQGTEVRLYLPVATPAPSPAPAATESDRVARHDDLRVLLVEDNAEVAFGTATVLESMGCRVHQAERADIALELLRADASRFDVVVSDVVMCGSLDGIGLAAAIGSEHPHLPIVLMSGYSGSLDSAQALGVEVQAKPCTPAALSEAMCAAIARRDAARKQPA
jgi:CheY-like chemotaxis protein